jgi:hypothetical protein
VVRELMNVRRHALRVVLALGIVFYGLGGAVQPAAAGGPAAALTAYLVKLDQARKPYAAAGPALEAALNALDSSPDATWVKAVQKVKVSRRAAEHMATAVGSVAPPSGLQKANQQLQHAAALAAGYLKQLGSALAAKSVPRVNRAVAAFAKTRTQINALDTSFRTAVTSAAQKAGVTVPSWVASLGNS